MFLKNKKGRSFVMIMVVIALAALFLRITAEKILSVTTSQNEAATQATLKSIATALDSYARDNQGVYPKSISSLVQSKPAYLDRDYIKESPVKGYAYNCARLDESGYICYAFPSRCKLTGNLAFTVTTGNILISEDCSLKK
ncbi:MAG: type II secretion system protein [Candidatus Omnitrophica bacterium]|nr:type II secretion system protein [Candidatus Omnitrophota bacterium]